MTSATRPSWFLVLFGLLAGCAADVGEPTPRLVSGGAADGGGAPWFTCAITTTGEGFFRSDTMTCAPNPQAVLAPSLVNVTAADGRMLGSVRLDAPGPLASIRAEDYPLRVSAGARIDREDALGVEAAEVRVAYTIPDRASATAAVGPEMPFEVWTLEVRNRTTVGTLRNVPRTVPLEGASTTDGATELEIGNTAVLLRGDESVAVRLIVPTGASSVRVTAGNADAEVEGDVTGPGAYTLTPAGLIHDDALAPESAGAELVRCERTDETISCALVVRDGVTIASATISRPADASELALPLDGTPVEIAVTNVADLPEALRARVVIASGIEGIDWTRAQPIEGDIAWDADGAAGMLDLPFDLLGVRFTIRDTVTQVFLDVDRHEVALRRAWGGAFDVRGDLHATLTDRTSALFAVSPGTLTLFAQMIALDAGFVDQRFPVELTDGDVFVVTPTGITEPTIVEPGAEIVRVWLRPDGISYVMNETLTGATVSLALSSPALPSAPALSLRAGGTGIGFPGLERLLPLTLTLQAEGGDGRAPVSVTRTVTALAEVSEATPLVLTTVGP
jgi:hypothetical protein